MELPSTGYQEVDQFLASTNPTLKEGTRVYINFIKQFDKSNEIDGRCTPCEIGHKIRFKLFPTGKKRKIRHLRDLTLYEADKNNPDAKGDDRKVKYLFKAGEEDIVDKNHPAFYHMISGLYGIIFEEI